MILRRYLALAVAALAIPVLLTACSAGSATIPSGTPATYPSGCPTSQPAPLPAGETRTVTITTDLPSFLACTAAITPADVPP